MRKEVMVSGLGAVLLWAIAGVLATVGVSELVEMWVMAMGTVAAAIAVMAWRGRPNPAPTPAQVVDTKVWREVWGLAYRTGHADGRADVLRDVSQAPRLLPRRAAAGE